jgi:hypothetical protein
MTDTAVTAAAAETERAAANLFRIMAALSAAREDVALLERLKGAEALVKRLTAEQDAALTTQNKAIAAEAKATDDERFARFSDINVTDKRPEEGLLSAPFVISYVLSTWDMGAHASVPLTRSVTGFKVLPHIVLEYLIERHPSKIPARIMALAPGNPRAAFDRYFGGLSRGYITGSLV